MITTRLKDSLMRKEDKFIKRLLSGALSLGMALEAIRKGNKMSQGEFAKKLVISQQHLCDIEKGRRQVSPKRAAQFAKKLGHPIEVFVQLALQDQVTKNGLKLKVRVEAA